MLPKLEAKFSTQLAGRLSTTATEFNLVSYKDKNGDNLAGLYGFLIDGETSSAEFVTGTIDAGTVTIVKRGLDFSDGTTEVAALKLEHVRGASVKITDFPVLGQLRDMIEGDAPLEEILEYDEDKTFDDGKQLVAKKYVDDALSTESGGNVKLTGNQTVAGVKTFSSSPVVPTPTTNMQAATKKYIDDIAIAGGVDASTSAKGIVKLNVAPASPTEPIAVGSNDTAETGASKVVRLKSNGKLNTTVLPVLTKGNIMVAGGANYDTALAVGTNGLGLIADSASPLGVKWADSAPYPIIRDYMTQYRPLLYRLSGDWETRVTFNNAKDSYRDFALWSIYSSGSAYYRYIERSDYDIFTAPNKKADGDANSFTVISHTGLYCIAPHGDYAYVFGWNGTYVTCARFAVDQNTGNASLSTVLIDSSGGGATNIGGRVLFSKTHLFLTTSTANTWNKYSLNESGTPTWECVGTVTMPTGTGATELRVADWTYIPNTSPEEWVFFQNDSTFTANPYPQYRKYIVGQSSSKYAYTNTHVYNQFSATNVSILRQPVLGIRNSMYELMTIEVYNYYDGSTYRYRVTSGIFEPLDSLPTFS